MPPTDKNQAFFYPNNPGALHVFRDGKHTLVTPSGARVRATSAGVPIPRVRMSKKDRKRARQKVKDAQAKLEATMAASYGRESEVRQGFVELLNKFTASYGRMPDELEKHALTVLAIENLPQQSPAPVAPCNTEPTLP